MAKKVKSYRLEEALIDRIAAYAASRGSSETQVIEAAAEAFLDDARGGVPDLAEEKAPVVKPKPKPIPTVRRASSLAARERANPIGAMRQAAMEARRKA